MPTVKKTTSRKKTTTPKLKLPDVKQLLEAGAHFGHAVKRWNPKMADYIYAEKNGIHIFDLFKTIEQLEKACNYLQQAAAKNKRIIFLGTKSQAVQVVKTEAERVGVAYVINRWVGGTLTNWPQIKSRIDLLKQMKEAVAKGGFDHYTKKEQVLKKREIERLERMYGGLVNLEDKPEVLVVVDPNREKTAVKEAKDVGATVVALADTNADPDFIDYLIPANDDALKSVSLIIETIAQAIEIGKKGASK